MKEGKKVFKETNNDILLSINRIVRDLNSCEGREITCSFELDYFVEIENNTGTKFPCIQ